MTAMTQRARSTRAALLDAARTVFADRGYAATRIIDIVAEAGMSVGSFYNYFEDKDGIFREVAMAVMDELTAAPRRDPGNVDRDPRLDIAHAVRRYVEVCTGRTRLILDLQQRSFADEVLRAHRATGIAANAERGAAFIRRLQDDGVVDPGIDPLATAMALQSMVVWVVYDHLLLAADQPIALDRLTDTLVGIWIRAVGLDPGAA
jgi:AcrR family transcriptional regulator